MSNRTQPNDDIKCSIWIFQFLKQFLLIEMNNIEINMLFIVEFSSNYAINFHNMWSADRAMIILNIPYISIVKFLDRQNHWRTSESSNVKCRKSQVIILAHDSTIHSTKLRKFSFLFFLISFSKKFFFPLLLILCVCLLLCLLNIDNLRA